MSPKPFFLNTGIILSLYVSVVTFITFLFNLINHLYPERDYFIYQEGLDGLDGLRFSISILVVSLPTFFILSRKYRKYALENPEVRGSKFRNWSLYLTVALATLALIVNLIVLVNTFLSGNDITLRFILKVLVVFLISGSVVWFYSKELKNFWQENLATLKKVVLGTSSLLIISIAGGLFLVGNPSDLKKERRDMTRVNDLQSVQWQIVEYYQNKGTVPDSLDSLVDPISGFTPPTDPLSHESYSYTKKTETSFTLCADFETEMSSLNEKADSSPEFNNGTWTHAVGNNCFERNIDTDKYPRRGVQVPKTILN